MADIIIKGEAHEAKIVFDYSDEAFTYECSTGVWCTIPKLTSAYQGDVIQDAIVHIDRHDNEREDGPAQPLPCWDTASGVYTSPVGTGRFGAPTPEDEARGYAPFPMKIEP